MINKYQRPRTINLSLYKCIRVDQQSVVNYEATGKITYFVQSSPHDENNTFLIHSPSQAFEPVINSELSWCLTRPR